MRDIKFRAWLPDCEIMLSDITIYSNGQIGVSADDLEEAVKNKNKDWHINDDGVYHSDEEHFDLIQNLLSGDDWYWIDDAEVMQYTGLKDENRKEIYEGDVISDGVKGLFLVEWNDDTCKFQFSDGTDINDGLRYGTSKLIMGNIYENPELLKGE